MKHINGYIIERGGYSVVDVIADITANEEGVEMLRLIARQKADNFSIPLDEVMEMIREWDEVER